MVFWKDVKEIFFFWIVCEVIIVVWIGDDIIVVIWFFVVVKFLVDVGKIIVVWVCVDVVVVLGFDWYIRVDWILGIVGLDDENVVLLIVI